jgi:hypothetical protein
MLDQFMIKKVVTGLEGRQQFWLEVVPDYFYLVKGEVKPAFSFVEEFFVEVHPV